MAVHFRVLKSRHLRQRWLIPFVSTVVLYALGYGIPALFFDIYIKPERIPADFGLQLVLALLVFAVSRRIWAFLLLQTLLIGILYIGSAIKTALLGRPIMPEDMHNVSALIHILGTKGWILVGLPLLAVIGLFIFNLRLRGRVTMVAWAVLIGLPVGAAAGPRLIEQTLDKAFNNFPWDQRQNYIYRGGTINFVQESVRAVAEAKPAPSDGEVRDAVARRQVADGPRVNMADAYAPGDPAYRHKRNIHIVLEESFWDADLLTQAHFSTSPMDPRFMALWQQTGYSHGMSPAFGGQTANAEFEILCGFPINEVAVKFEYGLKNNVPCLPRLLDQIGYRTIASHPNLPAFWNRQVAFKLLGFQTFWAGKDFKMDDLSGNQFLSDKSLHTQVAAKLAADRQHDQRPVLDYVVSIFGHWPYPPSDNDSHPDVVRSDTRVPEVVNYANAIYYKSRDMMDEIERLRRTDPDSVIVVFGDHLPTLGSKFAGFTESGVLADNFGDFTAGMYTFSAATPLIVIDGHNGPLHLGDLPMYRVPRLIMDLIGEDGPTIFDLAAPPPHTAPRPLPGVLLDRRDAQADKLCLDKNDNADCQQMAAWLDDVMLISHDIFSGKEHALKLLGGRAIAGGNGNGNEDADTDANASGDVPDAEPAHADIPGGDDGDALSFRPDAVQPAGNR
ncbi:MAG TPA: LTA synthase family protein [Terriglobales bacterium]|nr:LTA synthase family protein [Terriglobales bacterium]